MTIGVDDLLLAVAASAAQGFGKELGKELLNGIFSSGLATKEDLKIAVQQIQDFVHQEFEAVQDRAVVHDVDVALRLMNQYQQSGNAELLNMTQCQALLNSAWEDINRLSSSRGEDYFRVQFLPVSRFIAANVAFWSIVANDLEISGSRAVLVDALKDSVKKLKLARQNLHAMEDESISEISSDGEISLEPRDPGGPRAGFSRHFSGRAWFILYRGLYQNGQKKIETGWLYDRTSIDAVNILKPSYQDHCARIEKESNNRRASIYGPLDEALNSLLSLLERAGAPQASGVQTINLTAKPERI